MKFHSGLSKTNSANTCSIGWSDSCSSLRWINTSLSGYIYWNHLLRRRVHQFSSHMHEFLSHKLTGIFLPTLDHGFITSRRIFRSTPCFIGYTTIFLWILEIYFIFMSQLHDVYRVLPALRHYSPSTTGKEMTYPFPYQRYYYLLAQVLHWSNVNSIP